MDHFFVIVFRESPEVPVICAKFLSQQGRPEFLESAGTASVFCAMDSWILRYKFPFIVKQLAALVVVIGEVR